MSKLIYAWETFCYIIKVMLSITIPILKFMFTTPMILFTAPAIIFFFIKVKSNR